MFFGNLTDVFFKGFFFRRTPTHLAVLRIKPTQIYHEMPLMFLPFSRTAETLSAHFQSKRYQVVLEISIPDIVTVILDVSFC